MQRAVYSCGEQFGIVGDEQQGLVFAAAEGLNDTLGACPHHRVKPLERLVQNKQVGILDKGPRQQHQPLLAARQPHEAPVGQSLRTQSRHPRPCGRAQLLRDAAPAPDGIKQPRGNHIHRSHVVGKGAVHLGREVAYMSLYVPNALARAAAAVEERQIESIGTRVVGTYEAQKRTLETYIQKQKALREEHKAFLKKPDTQKTKVEKERQKILKNIDSRPFNLKEALDIGIIPKYGTKEYKSLPQERKDALKLATKKCMKPESGNPQKVTFKDFKAMVDHYEDMILAARYSKTPVRTTPKQQRVQKKKVNPNPDPQKTRPRTR